jgi:dGTPase
MLSFLKINSDNSGRRLFPEIFPENKTSPYQLDTIRITYSTSFRKLEYKTQVFFNNEGDYYRTRLTHTLEVAQISKIMTRILDLNSDLAEATSLIHDIGHTPFGHCGEDGLNDALVKYNYSKFNHNIQSLRIIDLLDKRYCDFDGLNLTSDTIEGILKHNGPIKNNQNAYLNEISRKYNINLEKIGSLEAQIASIADDIAYTNHDIEDGYRANILTFDDLKNLPIIGEFIKSKLLEHRDSQSQKMIIYETINSSIDFMIDDVITNIQKSVEKNNIKSLNDFFTHNETIAKFSDEVYQKCKIIRDYLFKNLYNNPEMALKRYKMRNIVTNLFHFYMENHNCLPTEWQERIKIEDDNHIVICDFIAGMTDRYALKINEKIFG